METRRHMEKKSAERLNESALIKQGFALYRKYAKTGQEVPAAEAETFQRLVKASLTDLISVDEIDSQENSPRRKRWTINTDEGNFVEDDRRFKDFRQDVGVAALIGKFKMADQDVGANFIRLFFGDQDAGTFRDVSLLSKDMGYRLNRYSLIDMQNLYFFSVAKIELGETFSADAHRAVSRLGSFLSAKLMTNADKDKIFIAEAVLNWVGFQRELEQKLSKGASPNQVKARMAANKEELNHLWTNFQTASIDQASDLIGRILYSAAENSGLQKFENSGVSGTSFSSIPTTLFAQRVRASAYQMLASEKYRQVENLPLNSFDAIELTKRAKQYEKSAVELWQNQQTASNQEVVHD